MSGTQFFKIHRSWEDWVGMLIGVLIGISPGSPSNKAIQR